MNYSDPEVVSRLTTGRYRWTEACEDDQVAAVLQLHAEGLELGTIAHRCGCRQSHVTKILKEDAERQARRAAAATWLQQAS